MKFLLTVAAVLMLTSVHAQGKLGKLVGRWEAVDSENQGIGLEVKDSSEIYIVYGSEKKRISVYKADFSKNPAWFDFTIKDSGQLVHLKTLINFVNDDLVQWQLFEGENRPEHFTEKEGEILYLRRKR
jgi:hypothetical protein